MSGKINDLSNSALRKRFFDNEFIPENNLTALSLRVSGAKQERGQSLVAQKEVTGEYCKSEGLKVERTWEVAESASKHEMRTHFHEIIAFVKKSQGTIRPIKHLVFSHQSRSNRNKQSARELEELCELGITLHFARDRRKLTCKSDIAELMMWHMENVRNQAYIDEITKNSMGGTIKCIERGCYPGSKLPFGYRSVGRKDRRQFVFDGDCASYMTMAFEIVDSATYSQDRPTDKMLKAKLDAQFPKLKTPHHKRFCELLRNPFYNGTEFIFDKTIFKSDPNIQPGLVSKERWLRVQDILDGRKRVRQLSKKLPYTGMMTCSGLILDSGGSLTEQVCGCAVTGEQIQKKYKNGKIQLFDYYRCSNQTRKCSQRDMSYMKTVVGRKVSFTDSEIEIIFQDIFKSFSFDEVTCQRMKQLLWAEHFEAKQNHNKRRSQIEQRMRELDGFIQQAYEDKLKGDIQEVAWRAMDAKWKSERFDIVAEYDSQMDTQDDYMDRGVQLIELMQHAEIIFKNATPEKKRKMVELTSSNLLLKDGSLQYHWRKPFDMLAVKGNLENWRSQGDSNPCILREREVS